MPIEKIYIARHGFRLNWQWTNFQSVTGLARDISLTSYGEVQADALAKHISSIPEEERPTAIFSSAWYRCLQTSKPIAEALKLPIYVEQGFGEWFSPAAVGTGLHPRPGPTSSLHQYFPNLIDTRYDVTWLPSRNGEDVAEIHSRVASFIATWFTRLELAEASKPIKSDEELNLGRHKNVLFVGHAASIITLARVLSGDRQLAMRTGTCSLSILVPKSDAKWTSAVAIEGDTSGTPRGHARLGEWSIIQNAAADFLPNGSERDWGFEDIEVADGEVVTDDGERDTKGEVEQLSERGLQIDLELSEKAQKAVEEEAIEGARGWGYRTAVENAATVTRGGKL
ncbi:phosphoglycerate mutase-like protein [Clavulina sp. PMI_390]|nr:phosphoglycerate mutase-like protein [Clavulina sp. PMI_390]